MIQDTKKPQPLALRLWPLYLILAGLAFAWHQGWFSLLSLETLREQRVFLTGFVQDHFAAAIVLYIAGYALATLFMFPGALWLTIAGGFMFGLTVGIPATLVGATLGASLLFFAARSSIGGALRERAGPSVEKMRSAFQEDAISYLFALRLLPIFPFPVSNIAPALLGAKYRDYFYTTFLGIIPGVAAYTWIGSGLGATFDAGGDPDLATLASNLIPALVALGVVALIPVAYKKLFGKKAAALEEAA